MTEDVLTTGELARRLRLTPKAIRLYDERGLLASRREGDGTRLFATDQVERAEVVAALRAVGVPLAVVADLLDAGDDAPAAFDRWWAAESRAHVDREPLAVAARRRLAGHPVLAPQVAQRDEPEQLVLALGRPTDAASLPGVLASSTAALFELLRPEDLAGPLFVVYRGRVSPDSSGWVETCAPVHDPVRPAGDAVLRVEPAARLAVSTVRVDAGFAAIAAVHDALAAWVSASDRLRACGPHREVHRYADPELEVAVPVVSR